MLESKVIGSKMQNPFRYQYFQNFQGIQKPTPNLIVQPRGPNGLSKKPLSKEGGGRNYKKNFQGHSKRRS